MGSRWRRTEKMPIALNANPFAVQRYIITAIGDHADIVRIAATRDEALATAARLRTTDAQIVTIARVEDAWKRQ